MPYVLIRREDIPDSLVQIEDLKPHKIHRDYVHSTPGQTGYVKQISDFDTPVVVLGPPDTVLRSVEGLTGYFVDRVEDAVSAAAITSAVAEAASTAIVARVRSGLALDAASIDAELIAAGAGAGTGIAAGNSFATVAEILEILAGRPFQLAAGSVVNDAAGNFSTVSGGAFSSVSRKFTQTGAFNISIGEGNIASLARTDFFYNGPLTSTSSTPNGVGAVIVVYADDGTLL